MVKDIGGQDDDNAGIEWAVDWGLEEGEELPSDVEELSDAQYTVWQFICVLRGVGDDAYKEELERAKSDRPSGILIPTKGA